MVNSYTTAVYLRKSLPVEFNDAGSLPAQAFALRTQRRGCKHAKQSFR